MKHLREWRMFESAEVELTVNQIKFLEATTKKWRMNPETGKVDVDGSVLASDVHWDGRVFGFGGRIPVEFGDVKKNFEFSANGLKSLAGAPQRVGGSVWVIENQLEDLVGGPEIVGGSYRCGKNPLRSLKGAPVEVGEDFSCMNTRIESLEGGPEIVRGDYFCQGNPALVSLKGAPKVLEGEFRCGAFTIQKGKWGIEGWMDVLESKDPHVKVLVSTLMGVEVLNRQIQEEPGRMAMLLKGILLDPRMEDIRRGLKWPPGMQNKLETLTDLSDIGL